MQKNILVISDLHTDFHRDGGKSLIKSLHSDDVDICVCAGDLSARINILERNICELSNKYPSFVYVTGNHEYFHAVSFAEIECMLCDLESKLGNFTWLNNKRAIVDGINFIGATLWFPKTEAAIKYKYGFNDFNYIPNCDPLVFEKNEATVAFFEQNMQAGDVVVTHHAPSMKSVKAPYIGDPYNCFFVNDLDNMIISKQPKLYIQGHTHSNLDYQLGSTRVCCNPFGYPNENALFNDSFIIGV
jgi:Icc-related predicted phosphoesterase